MLCLKLNSNIFKIQVLTHVSCLLILCSVPKGPVAVLKYQNKLDLFCPTSKYKVVTVNEVL